MQFNQIVSHKKAGRIVRLALLTMTVALLAVIVIFKDLPGVGGQSRKVMVPESSTKQPEFLGKLFAQVYRKTPEGKWLEIERIETTTSFSLSMQQAGTSGEVKSGEVWNGRTAKGHRVSIQMPGATKGKFDPKTGEMRLTDVPIEMVVDGKKDRFSFQLTTEEISTPTGALSGKRAPITGGAAQLVMVGKSAPKVTRIMDILDPVAGGRSGKAVDKAEQVNEQRAGVARGKNAGLASQDQVQDRIQTIDEQMMVVRIEGRWLMK
jgi:hypothetical protein